MHTKKEGIMRDDGNPDLEMMFVIAHKKVWQKKLCRFVNRYCIQSGLPIDTKNITNKNISKKLFRKK